MTTTVTTIHPCLRALKRPIDKRLYSITDEESAFFKRHTEITDEEELKKHILTVQAKAYAIFEYPCILHFSFLRCMISRLPAYKEAMALPSKIKGAILLDVGCCFGNDVRKAVDDGWPVEDTVASDLQQAFWDYGHELLKSNSQSFPVTFIAGDVFEMIPPFDPFYVEPDRRRPVLDTLTSLKPLQGHVSAIHTSNFFHLFSEEKQLELAQLLATLLSPAPGSMIFGCHAGKHEKGIRTETLTIGKIHVFCHSPGSWQELWDGQVFSKGTVRVDARLREEERPDLDMTLSNDPYVVLEWSVTRL